MAAFDAETVTSSSGPGPVSSEDMLAQGRALALGAQPLQTSSLLASLNQLRARAAGSTSANFPGIISQLGELRGTYAAASKAISRKLGFSGGGQTEREKGHLLAGAGRQYAGLLQGEQQEGFSGLLNTQSSVQPYLSGSARPPMTSTSERTNPFAGYAAGQLAGGVLPGQIGTLYDAFNKPKKAPGYGGTTYEDTIINTPENRLVPAGIV